MTQVAGSVNFQAAIANTTLSTLFSRQSGTGRGGLCFSS